MLLPEDWDSPSPDNQELCKEFDYGSYAENGLRMPYRFFVPQVPETVPLVVYLHGADAVGEDNEAQLAIHDIGTMFARKEWQRRHPCFVFAPQYGHGQHWSVPYVRKMVQSLIEKMVHDNDSIDARRIYLYGYSAGGVGTLGFLKDYPDFYAGAVSICGATGKDEMENLPRTPLWLVHAADDQIVKASYREAATMELAHFGSRDLFDELKGIPNWDFHYTEYPKGWMKEQYQVNPHCSWVAVSDERGAEIREWLFQQRRA